MKVVYLFSLLILPNISGAEILNQNRLSCLDTIKPITQKGFSTSFTFSEKVNDMNIKEFALALVTKEKKKNLMILPSTRNGDRGFYVYGDDSSFWYKLPKLKKNGEFLPLSYQISDKRISRSSLFLTYYDGVESNGKEYSNKSINLTTQASPEDKKSFAPLELIAIHDDVSQNAFDENFRQVLSTVENIRDRANHLHSPVERKKMQTSIEEKLNDCLSMFNESKDDVYRKLILESLGHANQTNAETKADPARAISK